MVPRAAERGGKGGRGMKRTSCVERTLSFCDKSLVLLVPSVVGREGLFFVGVATVMYLWGQREVDSTVN